MDNISQLIDFINNRPIGSTVEIATSQYADLTTAPGHRFDHYSSAQAVRGAIQRGLIEGECLWRYYECRILKHAT